MANAIVKIADMVGPVLIQQDNNTEELFNPLRNELEGMFLRRLMGIELGNLFLASVQVSGVPPSGRFLTIFSPIQENLNGFEVDSQGIKEMLKCILYFYYARDNNVRVTLAGNVNQKGENSTPNSDNFNLTKTYNKGIEIAQTIQFYIGQKLDVYPEYKGQKLRMAIGI